MSGGTISRNSAWYGGAVYLYATSSTFTMSGGTISGNTLTSTNSGKGIYKKNGTVNLYGGTISDTNYPEDL